MPRWLRFSRTVLYICALSACGGSQKPSGPNVAEARKVEPLRRKSCDGDSEKLVDVNGDGLADLRHVFVGKTEACTEIDLNFDGHIDLTRKFDDHGQITFEQFDLDFDGKLDQQSFYESGKLARKEIDTNFDRMIDTWMWCDGPYLGKLERDRHHHGRVDTWEQYRTGLLENAEYDDNTDGHVERWESYRGGR